MDPADRDRAELAPRRVGLAARRKRRIVFMIFLPRESKELLLSGEYLLKGIAPSDMLQPLDDNPSNAKGRIQ